MIAVSKDGKEIRTAGFSPDDPSFYIIDNPELEERIKFAFPDFEFVLDDEGNVIDIKTDKVPEPSLEEQVAALKEQNQMLTDCILEMSEIIYGGD